MGGREIALSDVILKYTGSAVKSDTLQQAAGSGTCK